MGGVSSQKRKARVTREQHDVVCTCPIDSNDRVYLSFEHEGRGLDNKTMEEVIERRVDANKEHICSCVKVMEILPHLEFLENTGTFRERQRQSQRDSMQLLISRLNESTEPRKWQCFLNALKTKGYEHITNRILGKPESDYATNKNMLRNLTPNLIQRMDPDEIVDKLLAAGVISEEDSQEIRREVCNNGKRAGASLILVMVPRRLDNWFSTFMSILEECDVKDITDKTQASELSVGHRKPMPLPDGDTEKDISHQHPKVNKVNTKEVEADFGQYEIVTQKHDRGIQQHWKGSKGQQKGKENATFAPYKETTKDNSHRRTLKNEQLFNQKELHKRDKEIQRLKKELKYVKKAKSNKYHRHAYHQRPTVTNSAPEDEKTLLSVLNEVLSRVSAIESKFEHLTCSEIKAFNSKEEHCTSGHNRHSNDNSIGMNRDDLTFVDEEHIYEKLEECIRPELTTSSECVDKCKGLNQSCTFVKENTYEEPDQCIKYDMATPNKSVVKPQIMTGNTFDRAGMGNSSFNADEHMYESPDACITSESTKNRKRSKRHVCNQSFIADEKVNEEPLSDISSDSARQNGCERNAESPTRKDDQMNSVPNSLFNSSETIYEEPDTYNEFESSKRSECGDNISTNVDEPIYDKCSIAYCTEHEITGIDNPSFNADYELYEVPSQLIRSDHTTSKELERKAERPKGAIGEIVNVGNPSLNTNEEQYDIHDLPISSKDNNYDCYDDFEIDKFMYENNHSIKHSWQRSHRPELMKSYCTVVNEECDNYTPISAHIKISY